MKFLAALLLMITSTAFASKILDESISVNPYALPGDSERNHLMLPGIRLHEANDFYGSTDKHTSEAMSLTVMGNWAKYFSTSVGYKGRFVQPALRLKNSDDKLATPIGIYAEWAEVNLNQSVTMFQDSGFFALKIDGGVTYNDFGDHSFTDIYQSVHEALGAEDDSDEFGQKLSENFIGSTASASLILALSDHINLIGSYQVMNSKIHREDAQEASLIWTVSKDLAFSAKYSFIKQINSEFYALRNNRTQFVGGVRLFKFWTPSIMYVSEYIKGDDEPQWYLSPLSLTYPF